MNWYKKATSNPNRGAGYAPQLDRIYTKQDMILLGADGYLSNAVRIRIPISKISGRDPVPSTYVDPSGEERAFQAGGEITSPIEVEYNPGNDTFVLYAGNHRLRQAEVNRQEYIWAFVGVPDDEEDEFANLLRDYGSENG